GLVLEPGKVVQVQVPKIAILGKIDAPEGEKLVKAEWVKEPQGNGIPLTKFAPGKDERFPIREEMALQPGAQTLRFRAKTANSDEAERFLTVFYQPPLPPVEVLSPQRDAVRYGAKESETIELRARLGSTGHPHAYQAK